MIATTDTGNTTGTNPALSGVLAAGPIVRHIVTTDSRAIANGHRGAVLWLTGLPASGKSSLAMGLERELFRRGRQVFVLDGEILRQGISRDLGYSDEDRGENVRRAAEIAKLFSDAGLIVVVAMIAPFRADRAQAREIVGSRFFEIYVKADLATCERRDPKGLYKAARANEIDRFTGVSAPYESPINPELVIDTTNASIEASLARLVAFVDGGAAPLTPVDAWAI